MKEVTVVKFFWVMLLCFSARYAGAQAAAVSGKVVSEGKPLEFASVGVKGKTFGTTTDAEGMFTLAGLPSGSHTLLASFIGCSPVEKTVVLKPGGQLTLEIELAPVVSNLEEVVVTGTLREVSRLESPVPVEVFKPSFFRKNPTPNICEALQNVNGVRPQLNCNVCNTGDIHINGLEGPYTMVLIDGMPIVSSLATVYGLSGIPNSLVERMEIVKGPASSLYGSEAIGGLINIITKDPKKAPLLSVDLMATSWKEYNADLGFKFNLGGKASVLTGVNYFNFDNIVDNNGDHFTDVALQERISVFQKWRFSRKEDRLFTLAGRYYYEDRWGGELDWTEEFRGGDEVYGESIYTERWELFGNYQLPADENLMFSFSLNGHQQNSVYGGLSYIADQRIGFGQLTWDEQIGKHSLLLGAALRYTFYDDNTPATAGPEGSPGNKPDEIWLPGLFIQDEISLGSRHKLLLGMRYDHSNIHGSIFTPRLAYKWPITEKDILRFNAGTGFRAVNLFTEEHAALTGAREVVITEALKPEQSYNVNLNYTKKIFLPDGGVIGLDASAWHTHFRNVILPDYETNANQIIYDNLKGYAVTQGVSANIDLAFPFGLSVLAGATFMDVASVENGARQRPALTERFAGTWAVSWKFLNDKLSVDYTGNIYGPMRLPLLGELDPRRPESPAWSIQNIQLTYSGLKNIEIYGGVKNLLDWTPNEGNPFIIARAFDPFDRNVEFDAAGKVIPTPGNPYALTFDPSYVYGPNQGIRGFLGARYSMQ